MKTILDLPDELVKEVKLQAVHHDMKLNDAVAYLLRKGLATERTLSTEPLPARIKRHKKTGLPIIECGKKGVSEMDANRTAEILLKQQSGWNEQADR